MSWQEQTGEQEALPKRKGWTALRRGFLGRCPNCGRGKLFRAFLKVADRCPDCGTELHHHRADDAPAYFVILIVGHIVVPLALVVEIAYRAALLAPCPAVGDAHHRPRDRAPAADQGRHRRLAMGELHARLRSPRRARDGAAVKT